MDATKLLTKFGISEQWLLEKFSGELDKAKNEEDALNIVIYGGENTEQKALAQSIFDDDFIEKRITFVQNAEEIPLHTDIVFAINSTPLTQTPCFCVNQVSNQTVQEILNWATSQLSRKEAKALARYQKVDFDLKEKFIKPIIAQHCAVAFGVGATPIPGADAPLLVLNELTILSRICNFYGLESATEVLKIFGANELIKIILTTVGKIISGKILSFFVAPIPGIKNVIDGGTATAVTLAFAFSVSKTVKLFCKKNAKQIQNIEFLQNSQDVTLAIAGTMEQCLEDGKTTAEDYENFDISVEQLMANIKKGNELFQKFLDENAELDNEFKQNQEKSENLSSDMWNAINNI